MKRKKRGSVFAGLLVFVLLIIVACTVAVNLIFSGQRVPRVAGYYLYLQESADMEPSVPAKSLVAAEAAVISELHEGNKVLCYLADGTLALRNIYKIEETEDGTVNYYPGTAVEQGTDLVIPRTNIFAVCVWASPELYQYITFARTVNGLMALLVAPCVVLIFMLLVHIVRNGSEDIEDDEFSFEEDEEEEDTPPKKKKVTENPPKKKKVTENPLYQPEKTAPVKLEEKKSSISENFSAKPVNENSPYQKAVQEREKTMKVRRQEIEEEALRALEAPVPKQKKASSTQVYSVQEIREQAQQQTVPAAPAPPPPMHTAVPPMPAPQVQPQPQQAVQAPEPVQPPAPQPAPAVPAEPKPEPPKPAPAKPVYSSPNIDDILQADKKSKSEISSSDSIDDLIRMIEKEKKKL